MLALVDRIAIGIGAVVRGCNSAYMDRHAQGKEGVKQTGDVIFEGW